ncbi:TPA: hypothetical protein ACPWHI_002318 [Pseudomonas aeruginosa]|nr:hypothetical protein [Pseudomonas aeruginosa]HBO1323884.1 hypothetical protein [Pseudomonas aeruginosa]HCK4566661.1 hypothetical protein [Pseudomonas aeruginosa]
MKTLFQKYTEYTNRLKAQGVQFLAFDCPRCGFEIETERPPQGELWDTLSSCPHCEALFFEVATHERAEGRVPACPTTKH